MHEDRNRVNHRMIMMILCFLLGKFFLLSDLFDLALTYRHEYSVNLRILSFTLLYSRGVPFVINKYCSYQLSYNPVKYRSGIDA